MSAQQTFAYCLDCQELNYGIPDKNGVYTRDSASSNHWNHHTITFTSPDDYPPPIRLVLIKLGASAKITDNEIVLFKLAIMLEGVGDPEYQTYLTRERALESSEQGVLL